jgi:DNA-binding MarR family transcriptional regulator
MNKAENSTPMFIQIPGQVLDDPNLTPVQMILYGRILALTNSKGYCWATNASLAEAMHMKKPGTISHNISTLEKMGYISTELIYFPNSKKVKERRIRVHIKVGQAGITSKVNITPKGNTGITPKGTTSITSKVQDNIESNIKTNIEREPSIQNQSLMDNKEQDLFNTLVANYPKHLVKPNKLKWAIDAFGKLSQDEAQAAVDNLNLYLTNWSGYIHTLENYITGKYFTKEALSLRQNNKPKDTYDTKHNIGDFS